MELFIIVILLAIAAETTYLSVRTIKKEQKMALSPVFVDTSVLIDGRIIAIAESGFLTRPLYIPRSVVGELQFLADNADTEKRTRARHGLDIISQLQAMTNITTHIFPDGVKADEGVDNRLLTLAKKHNGSLCTIDYNLNKVAVVEGLEVLNVNELAKSLRMAYLPGEQLLIELTQKGNDQHQAVGHLPDGTMVVVEHASKFVGSSVEVEFIRSLQTAAGKMMFAKLVNTTTSERTQRPTVQQKVHQKVAVQQKPKQQRRVPRAEQSQASQVRKTANTKPVTQKSSARRPRSPEDSLMDLVNRQD